jgi:hypothetical protein
MGRLILLVSSITSIFVLSWSLTRYAREMTCLNSTLVSKVDKIHGNSYTLKTCDLAEKILAPNANEEILNLNLISRIEALNGIAYLMPKSFQKTHIVITVNEDEVSFRNDRIYMGIEALKKPDLLERAIITKNFYYQNPMSSEVIAEVLLSIFRNESIRPARPWFKDIRTLSMYCKEDSLAIHNEFCAAHNELNQGLIFDGEYGPSPWSLKPLYVDLVLDIFTHSTLEEQRSLISNLIFIGEPDDGFLEVIDTSGSIQKSEAQIIRMLAAWLSPLGANKNLIAKAIKQRLISTQPIDAYIVIARSARDDFPIGEWANGYHIEGHPMAVEFGLSTYFFPSDVAFKLKRHDAIELFRPKKVIYVSCEIPSLNQLKSMYGAEQVMFLRSCHADEIDWFELARLGVDRYIEYKPDTQFMEFNVPALMFAERVRGPLREQAVIGDWQKWLIWQSVENEELSTGNSTVNSTVNSAVKKPLAVIEGVKRFRMTQ